MKLYVVRHGETNYNVNELLDHTTTKDVYLTELGIKQAYDAKSFLQEKTWDVVIISEMYRSEQTAAIINEDDHKPMFIDPLINEMNTGLSGHSYEEYRKLKDAAENKYTFTIGDGESFFDVKKRVFAFMDNLKKKSFSSVLIVTHHAIVRMIVGYCNQLSDEQIWNVDSQNADIYELDI